MRNIILKKILPSYLFNTFFLRPRSWNCFYKILLDYPQELTQNQLRSYIGFLSWYLCLILWYKTPGRCRTRDQELRSHIAYSPCCLILQPKLWNWIHLKFVIVKIEESVNIVKICPLLCIFLKIVSVPESWVIFVSAVCTVMLFAPSRVASNVIVTEPLMVKLLGMINGTKLTR